MRLCSRWLISERSSSLDTYIVFSTYSITTCYSSNKQCVISSGSSVILTSSYSLTKSLNIDSALFQEMTESLFVNLLEFTSCSDDRENVVSTSLATAISDTTNLTVSVSRIVISLTTVINSISESLTSSSSMNITLKPVSFLNSTLKFHQKDAKLTIDIAVSIDSIALFALEISLLRIYRKQRHTNTVDQDAQENSLAFLQRKVELEAKERSRYELLTLDIRHELETRKIRLELHDELTWQKLRDAEHSQELEIFRWTHQFCKCWQIQCSWVWRLHYRISSKRFCKIRTFSSISF